MYNIQSKEYLTKQKIMESPQFIKTHQATKEIDVYYSNRHVSNIPSTYPKHRHKRAKNKPKSARDYNAMYKRADEALKNNFFADNLINTFYAVLTISDKRIKSVSLVREWVKDYIKSFKEHEVFAIAMIELDEEHHPHVHALITTLERSQKSLLTTTDIESHWTHGITNDAQPRKKYKDKSMMYYQEYLSRLLNYSIKTYSGYKDYNMVFDKEKALKYKRIVTRLEHHKHYLIKLRNSMKTRASWERINNKIAVTCRLLHSVANKRKRELQKQYIVEDKPLYIKYGKLHPLEKKLPTLEELADLTKDKEFQKVRRNTIRNVDNSTGEVLNKMSTFTEKYL